MHLLGKGRSRPVEVSQLSHLRLYVERGGFGKTAAGKLLGLFFEPSNDGAGLVLALHLVQVVENGYVGLFHGRQPPCRAAFVDHYVLVRRVRESPMPKASHDEGKV